MINGENKQCKSKGCCNPILEGRYCQCCTQKRREKREKILAAAAGVLILGGGVAKKKGLIKKAPKIATKVLQGVLRL